MVGVAGAAHCGDTGLAAPPGRGSAGVSHRPRKRV